MTEQILIEGDTAKFLRTEVVRETLLANITPYLVTKEPFSSGILPANPVRFVHLNYEEREGIFVIETAPRRTWMQMIHDSDDGQYPDDAARGHDDPDGIARFHVALPWQYFVYRVHFRADGPNGQLNDFSIQHARLFWARNQLRSETDTVIIAQCPNVDNDGRICWGNTRSDATHLSARLDDLVNNFWSTRFNEHLGHQTPYDGSMTEWEKNSDGAFPHHAWDIWETHHKYSITEIVEEMKAGGTVNMPALNPAHVDIPELPANFTVARAREWLNGLTEGARRRLLVAADGIEINNEPVALAPEPAEATA